MLKMEHKRRVWLMCSCSFCFIIMCVIFAIYTTLRTPDQLHHKDDGSEVINKHSYVEFNRSNSRNCSIRKISIMKKTAYFTHVGLLSFPGSGNTWTRYLIQQLTGHCTGSVYCSKVLLNGGFPGECVHPKDKSNGCILYKSHKMVLLFDKAVILIRNPYDVMKTYFNWKFVNTPALSSNQNNTVVMSNMKEHFEDPHFKIMDIIQFNSSKWKLHVKRGINGWKQNYISWFKIFKDRCLIVRYEDLKENFIPTLRRIGNFLNVRTSEEDYACTYVNREGLNHRIQQYKLRITDIFTEQQINTVNDVIMQVMLASGNKYGLEDFIYVNSEV